MTKCCFAFGASTFAGNSGNPGDSTGEELLCRWVGQNPLLLNEVKTDI